MYLFRKQKYWYFQGYKFFCARLWITADIKGQTSAIFFRQHLMSQNHKAVDVFSWKMSIFFQIFTLNACDQTLLLVTFYKKPYLTGNVGNFISGLAMSEDFSTPLKMTAGLYDALGSGSSFVFDSLLEWENDISVCTQSNRF